MKTEERLSDLLTEFPRTSVTDFPIPPIHDLLITRIATAASTNPWGPKPQPQTGAASKRLSSRHGNSSSASH